MGGDPRRECGCPGQCLIFTRTNPPVQVYDRSGKLIRSWEMIFQGSSFSTF